MRFPEVTDEASAIEFLNALNDEGMMYHPEEDAAESLHHLYLAADLIEEIASKMRACFEFLGDPCIFALEIINA